MQQYTLHYNWLPENFIWVATGISIVAAVLSIIVEAVRAFRSQSTVKDDKQGFSMAKAMTTVTGVACTVACVASLVSAIYVNATHNQLANKCSLVELPTKEYEYTCTRELMSCKWGPAYDRADGFQPWEGYASACGWTVSAPLTIKVLRADAKKTIEIWPSYADSAYVALGCAGFGVWFTDLVGQERSEGEYR